MNFLIQIISTTESWISANLKCIDDDAQLASFEDVQVLKLIINCKKLGRNNT